MHVATAENYQKDEAGQAEESARAFPFPGQRKAQYQPGHAQELQFFKNGQVGGKGQSFAEDESQVKQEDQRPQNARRPAAGESGPPGPDRPGCHRSIMAYPGLKL